LGAGALAAELRPEVDLELIGGLAGVRERPNVDDAADADVHLEEVIEGDRHGWRWYGRNAGSSELTSTTY
jgi:hypothetical protein